MINILNIPRIPRVVGRLGNARKPQSFSVQVLQGGRVIVQSDKSIGEIDLETGHGRYNPKGHYFPHLALARPYQFPPEFVEQVRHAAGVFSALSEH